MNVHYGKIGDVWKHLPLVEILSIERPTMYWDIFAGAAEYPLTHSWERDYGVFHVLKHGPLSPELRDSVSLKLLIQQRTPGESPEIYPGSPCWAMAVLGRSAEYLLCDADPDSVESIRRAAKTRDLPEATTRCVGGEGIETVQKAFSQLPDRSLSNLFVLIDPYDPFVKNPNCIDAADLFFRIASKGVRAMLWYGWDTPAMHERVWKSLAESFHLQNPDGSGSYWCGEIFLAETANLDASLNPDCIGCGILCGNLSDDAIQACVKLGQGLATIYRDTRLPGNPSGAIDFSAPEPWNS